MIIRSDSSRRQYNQSLAKGLFSFFSLDQILLFFLQGGGKQTPRKKKTLFPRGFIPRP
jgi:hypothetical protein